MSASVTTLYASRYCQGLDTGAAVSLPSAAQWSAFIGQQQDKSASSIPMDGDAQIVLINMGQQRTAGYGIRLAEDGAQLQGDTLRLSVVWEIPQPGMMQAQVITHPCLAVSVKGEFHNVQVVDQDDRVRLVSANP